MIPIFWIQTGLLLSLPARTSNKTGLTFSEMLMNSSFSLDGNDCS